MDGSSAVRMGQDLMLNCSELEGIVEKERNKPAYLNYKEKIEPLSFI